MLKLFQCFISHVTTNYGWNWNKIIAVAERVLKLFKIIPATLNMKNIHKLQ